MVSDYVGGWPRVGVAEMAAGVLASAGLPRPVLVCAPCPTPTRTHRDGRQEEVEAQAAEAHVRVAAQA